MVGYRPKGCSGMKNNLESTGRKVKIMNLDCICCQTADQTPTIKGAKVSQDCCSTSLVSDDSA